MADYDDIVTPVQGQPISSSGFGIKVRNAIIDLGIRMGVREAAESLPPAVEAHVSNIIAVTSASFAALPSPGPCQVVMTNPSSDFDLVCMVSYSAWISIGTATDVRAGLAASGGMTFGPTSFTLGGKANSENLFTQSTQTATQQVMIPIIIPAGAAAVTFAIQALRTTSGSGNFNYPVLRVTPVRFQDP